MADTIEKFLEEIGSESRKTFETGKNILSFREYLSLVAENPRVHLRDAAGYIRDMFDFFGTREVHYPWRVNKRFILFDQLFGSKEDALWGQEDAQTAFYNILQSFVRAGKPHRLILLHGPNGSSKTTFISCIARALEYYSTTQQGAIYRFNWVFPSEKAGAKGLGFIKESYDSKGKARDYAHYDESEIDAKLICELKDHPFLLLPVSERRKFIDKVLPGDRDLQIPELILNGNICPKCKLIFDALLNAYRGDLSRVYDHVQVERFTISRKYRRGFVSIGPQMAVDAGERQVTIDRSLGALPKVLQNVSLFEPYGDLVDGSGGMIEFSDLLKRPVESFKYLLEAIETGEVQIGGSNQRINAVLVATSNEIHLNAFKQHPDALSFLGRINMVRIPYILNEPVERSIYLNQVARGLGKHVAPYSIEMASSWAVMTRLFKPKSESYPEPMKSITKDLLCTEKFDVYAEGKIPPRFSGEEAKVFSQNIEALYTETENQPLYEGITGASPREVKFILYMAAQNPSYECLTPMAVLEELETFIKRTKDFSFLNMEKKEGHYHDFKHFIEILRIRLLQKLLASVVEASNIFSQRQFEELWDRYVVHASTWIKGEKVLNPVTKKHEDPDEALMGRVETLLNVKDKKAFREEVINRIAADAIERGAGKSDYSAIFRNEIESLKAQAIKENIEKLKGIVQSALDVLRGEKGIEGVELEEVNKFLERLQEFNYCPKCAKVALGYLMKYKLQE